MIIPLIEPTSPRYIHVNPTTNRVHLLVPFVGGQDISTDNTCCSTAEVDAFFGGGGFSELESYKSVLEFHISLLEAGDARRAIKEERLAQIKTYLDALKDMQAGYQATVNNFLSQPSNLYSIQLRPRVQDSVSRVVNPVFTIKRDNDDSDTPLSPLYNKMHEVFPELTLGKPDPHKKLIEAVLAALSEHERTHAVPDEKSFANIQDVLTTKYIAELPKEIGRTVKNDFFKSVMSGHDGKETIDKAYIDRVMAHSGDEPPEAYVAALLRLCAPSFETSQEGSPFYQVNSDSPDKAERLSMMTQFYLGVLNIYCRAQSISSKNFGEVLDSNAALSKGLVDKVSKALAHGAEVEEVIIAFVNQHKTATEFNLSEDLSLIDKDAIQAKFEITYRTVTATKENPHMDDFMILDTEARGEHALFFTQKGLICTDFANIATTGPNQAYFAAIRAEAATHPDVITRPQDEAVMTVEIEPEALVDKLDTIEWDKLSKEVVDACRALPAFQLRQFLDDVAKGKQDDANNILNASNDKQMLLRTPAKFTDYSGRTFNCTAYEYAYWAKDTHMCRMLEPHMDDATKTFMLGKVNEMEDSGLAYQQHGIEYKNPHYDVSFVLKDLSPDEFSQLRAMVGQNVAKINNATVDSYQNLPFSATEYEQLKKELAPHASVWNWMLSCLGSFEYFGYLTYPEFFLASFFITPPAQAIANKLTNAFDFKSLITALNTYVTNYDSWDDHQRVAAWLDVGMAQREVPVHIANEYCRSDRSFHPCPEFNELTLPRVLTFDNWVTNVKSWFPLTSSSSGLGLDFAISGVRPRGAAVPLAAGPLRPVWRWASIDLAAVSRLVEVRAADLTQSHAILSMEAPNSNYGSRA